MHHSYKNNTILLLLILCSLKTTFAMEIITTDFSSMYSLNVASQEITINTGGSTNVTLIDEKELDHYLQLGNVGDILVSSDKTICSKLSQKGLASPMYITELFKDYLYYINQDANKKVIILTTDFLPSSTRNKINQIAHKINSTIFINKKHNSLYQEVSGYIKSQTSIYGFHPTFANLNLQKNTLNKTSYGISYYACPLVGLHHNTYQTLKKYYDRNK